MSQPIDQTIDRAIEMISRVNKLMTHEIEHVVYLPVIIKRFDSTCESCQGALKGIRKKSENAAPGYLSGPPVAAVVMTTVLCFQGMHEECMKDYVNEKYAFEVRCNCRCHEAKSKKREPTKKTKHKSR